MAMHIIKITLNMNKDQDLRRKRIRLEVIYHHSFVPCILLCHLLML